MEKAYDFLKSLHVSPKPRQSSITIASEKAKSFQEAKSFIETVGSIIDYVKFPDHAGLMWRCSPEEIKAKNKLYFDHNIQPLPGGIPFEVAAVNNKIHEYMERTAELGFKAVEISSDSIELDSETRFTAIKNAIQNKLTVFSEIGKKNPKKLITRNEAIKTAIQDIEAGAKFIVIEKSEVAIAIKNNSKVIHEVVKTIGLDKIVVECGPGEDRFEIASWLIKEFGSQVNIENIDINEVYIIESMRQGLHRAVDFNYFEKFLE